MIKKNDRLQVAKELAAPTVDDLDAVFKGFADPTRIRILSVLAAGELCVCDIVDILRLPQPAVSRHLAYLRRMGLVDATREWKFAHYRLAKPAHARAPKSPQLRAHLFPWNRVAGPGARRGRGARQG